MCMFHLQHYALGKQCLLPIHAPCIVLEYMCDVSEQLLSHLIHRDDDYFALFWSDMRCCSCWYSSFFAVSKLRIGFSRLPLSMPFLIQCFARQHFLMLLLLISVFISFYSTCSSNTLPCSRNTIVFTNTVLFQRCTILCHKGFCCCCCCYFYCCFGFPTSRFFFTQRNFGNHHKLFAVCSQYIHMHEKSKGKSSMHDTADSMSFKLMEKPDILYVRLSVYFKWKIKNANSRRWKITSIPCVVVHRFWLLVGWYYSPFISASCIWVCWCFMLFLRSHFLPSSWAVSQLDNTNTISSTSMEQQKREKHWL